MTRIERITRILYLLRKYLNIITINLIVCEANKIRVIRSIRVIRVPIQGADRNLIYKMIIPFIPVAADHSQAVGNRRYEVEKFYPCITVEYAVLRITVRLR